MKRHIFRFACPFTMLFLAAAFAVLFAGCKKQTEEIKIGAIFSVTGPASNTGDPEKKTLEMLADELNKSGGIDGKKVTFIIEDDASEESKTKAAASKLIDKDGVAVIIGPSLSGNTMAIKDLAGQKKVPLVSCALAEAIVNPLNDWVFKTPQRDAHVAEHVLIRVSRMGIKNVAVLYENTGFGQEGLKQLEALAGKYRVNIVLKESFEKAATESDIVTLLTKVKGDKSIGAVIAWSVAPAQAAIPKKMKELDMALPVFASQGFGNLKFAQAAGPAAENVIFPGGKLLVADQIPKSDKQQKIIMEYKNAYEKKYNEPVSVFGSHAFDAFWITVNAIRRAGSGDREKIREAIEATQNFVGVDGIYNFTKQDHNGLGMDSLEMITVRGGKFVLSKE